MDKREIQTLMYKLFYGDIDQTDGWRHLMKDGSLDKSLFNTLLNDYIYDSPTVLVYLNAQHCTECLKEEAFDHLAEFLKSGTVRIADPRFHARLMINPIGVGIGHASSGKQLIIKCQ